VLAALEHVTRLRRIGIGFMQSTTRGLSTKKAEDESLRKKKL